MNQATQELLAKIKKNDLANDVPSISFEVASFLHNLILENQCKNALEIGCAHGYSSLWLGSALEENNGHLTTLDHSDPSFFIAQENIKKSGLTNIDLHLGKAQAIVPKLQNNFDFIFIDGIKKSTLEFFDLCTPKLSQSGIVVIDDVIKFKYKMSTFYDFIEKQTDWNYQIHQLDSDDGIMVIKRN